VGGPQPRRAVWRLLERDQIIVYGLGVLLLGTAGVRYAGPRWASPSPLRPLDAPRPIEYQIDLNRAEACELDLLPGIGPVRAKQIVRYREKRGPFHQLEDLRKVPGMGRDRVEKLRGLVRVGLSASAGEPPR
jgi:competence protein ComEA